MTVSTPHGYKVEIGDKYRVLLSAALRSAALLDKGDELVASVLGKGVVLLETREAISDRVHANAAGVGVPDATALIRANRDEDIRASEESWARKVQLAREAESRPEVESEAVGLAMLRAIGL